MKTFDELRAINRVRQQHWEGHGSGWSLSDWGVAAGGEMGEMLNVIKKLNRARDGMVGNGALTEADLRLMLADEIADIVIYLDLLCDSEGIDLAEAVAVKFNKSSLKIGSSARLPMERHTMTPDGPRTTQSVIDGMVRDFG